MWEKINSPGTWYNASKDALLTITPVSPSGFHRVEYSDESGNLCKLSFDNYQDALTYTKEYMNR